MLDLKTLHPQYVTDENGEQTAVIIPIGTFRELLEDHIGLGRHRREKGRAGHPS